MKATIPALLAAGLLVGPTVANAVTMPHTYRLEFGPVEFASSCLGCDVVPTNLQAIATTLTIDFDPLFSSGLTSVTSLTFDSAYQNSLFGPGFLFRYDTTTIPNVMTLGDHCLGDPMPLCSFTLSLDDMIMLFRFSEAGDPLFASIRFRVNGRDYTSDTQAVREVTGVSVPEPGTLALVALGLTGLALGRRRRGI